MNPIRNNVADSEHGRLREQVTAESRSKHQQGAPLDELVAFQHDAGLSIVDSMWALNQVLDLPLEEAKKIVTRHPAWKTMVEANEPFHDELEQSAQDTTISCKKE